MLLNLDRLQNGILDIVGYFALALHVLKIPSNISVRQIKALDGFSGKIHGERISALPVFLIGQLAKNDLYAKELSGKELLDYALEIILRAKSMVAGRLVLIDAHDSEGLLDFYRKNGFDKISKDEKTELVQLVRVIK